MVVGAGQSGRRFGVDHQRIPGTGRERHQLSGRHQPGPPETVSILDNRFDSEQYRENVRQLTPAIMAVLPLEYRHRLLPEDSFMSRLARLEKETSEAKVAVAMNAPRHQKLKELSEGIVEMFRVDPDLTAPLMAMVTSMLGVM